MPSSEQENCGSGALLLGGSACRGQAGCRAVQPVTAAAAPFRFHAPRCHIDWCALHALDLGAVVRESDIDALESVLDLVAGGDIEAEDARSLTPANFIQLFRTAQLTLDYLLHVQDRLAGDSTAAQGEAARLRHQVQLLQLKVKEVREELVGTRKEARHLKKSLRSFEVGGCGGSGLAVPMRAACHAFLASLRIFPHAFSTCRRWRWRTSMPHHRRQRCGWWRGWWRWQTQQPPASWRGWRRRWPS